MLWGLALVLAALFPPPASARLISSVEPAEPAPPPTPAAAREVTALPADAAMEIDGAFDEPCWQGGLWIGDFTLNDGTGRRPEAATEFKVRFDAGNVYVALRASEPHMARLRATEGAAHDEKAFNDDCFEVWFDPDNLRRQAYHLIYSVAGGTYDTRQREELRDDPAAATPGVKRTFFTDDTSWEAHGEVAFRKAADGWAAELRLPVADLGAGSLIPGSLWGFNAARERYAFPEPGRAEYSSLTGVFCGPMASFANLRLGMPSLEVTALDLGALGVGRNTLRFDCGSAREAVSTADVRLTVRAGKEQTVRKTLELKGRETHTESLSYTLPTGEFSLALELLRTGTEEPLFRRAVSGRLDSPLRVRPRGPIAYLGRDPWWVDAELLLGDVSRGAAELQVTVRSADGRVVARETVRKLYPSLRLRFDLRSIRREGDYRLTFAVTDGGETLGEASLPLRLLRPPSR